MNQIEKIKYKLGYYYTEVGSRYIQEAFKLNPKTHLLEDVIQLVNKYKLDSGLIDNKYWIESIETWKDIIDGWWGKEREWVADRFDCDNFSQYFQAWTSWYFNLNTAGRVFGTVYNLDGSKIGNHYWSAIITEDENNKLHLWMFEPQNGLMIEYQGNEFVLGNMRYTVGKVYFG